ncbi:MAG: D-2-hydroxyacid dehydrogenase [Rhodocyclaceae bacterium]|nr:D-2-hydroxyacid dehydrogenase [Rhodocyclaceae bacterium]
MKARIVVLEGASLDVPLRRPQGPHEWVEHAVSAPDTLRERLAGAQIAVVNKLPVRGEDLAHLPDLRMIAVSATGTDNVDLAACRARGIVVSNVRGYAVTTVPEHVMALMLALSRRLLDYHRDVRAGRWQRSANFCFVDYPITDLAGTTLAIIGGGSLGQGVARLAEAFGMRVLFAERRGAATLRPGRVAFETALREADVISLHCPLNAATRHLINAATLAAMRPSARLINTARGGLIDEAALADALRTGRIAGAALDVLSTEPPSDANPLLAADLPNLLITPHVAWASRRAMQALADQVTDNIDAFLAGQPRNVME